MTSLASGVRFQFSEHCASRRGLVTPGNWSWQALDKRVGAQSPRWEAEPEEQGTHAETFLGFPGGGVDTTCGMNLPGQDSPAQQRHLEMTGACLFDFFLLLGKTPPRARKTPPRVLETQLLLNPFGGGGASRELALERMPR